ncbi:lipase family alpha/beta hydrolase [Acinetobacter sp. CE-15]|uniref:esterase/lipase family protein n=1 Tax=Acinetobacter sp. CE-15 TaxID=3425693 RepID=UPI003DA39AC6
MSNHIHRHEAYERLYKSGSVSYVSHTTPDSVNTECEIPAPVTHVVPIIFIPGIMGSNIKDTADDKEVWYPRISLSTIIEYSKRDARERQIALNPATTQVGYDGDVKISKKRIPHITKDVALARGWGSVITIGYADLLIFMESQLNQPFKKLSEHKKDQFNGTTEWEKIVHPGNKATEKILKNWSAEKTVELLGLEKHEQLADYAFPVFACGYNWLQTNMKSADHVADRLNNEVMAQVKNEFPSAKFKKFIIVSHSMGGLVTRALIQNEKVKDKIAGVVHGAMPASGAPAVYQRLTVGWDGWKASTGLFKSAAAWATKFMFGNTSERLTAILANAPGGLELLPFSNYSNTVDFPKNPKAWLVIKAKTPSGEITATLPKSNDPYNDIYKRKDCWWAMINPDFIDPAGLVAKTVDKDGYDSIFDVYRDTLVIVKKLHDHIKDAYHPNTYANYAADNSFKAFGQVVWRCKEELNISSENELIELMSLYGKKKLIQFPDIKDRSDIKEADPNNPPENDADLSIKGSKTHNLQDNAYKEDGVREILLDEKSKISKTNKATFYLDLKPTSKGDGTVCYQSGQDVRADGRSPIETFIINGYEHAKSYDDKHVQLNTIYCIANIIDIIKQTSTSEKCESETKRL